MAFHLEGPWLSTTGKKRGPRKWASAEAKRKAELLQQEWEQRLGNFKKMAPKFSRTPAPPAKPTGTLKSGPRIPPGRETPTLPAVTRVGCPVSNIKIPNTLVPKSKA
jgi:hypothetical protein